MDLTLHQMRVFIALIENGGVTRAAERLHLSQPAVSVQLKNLQDQFGTPLFELNGRRLRITEFGEVVAAEVREILNRTAGLAEREKAYHGLLTGKLEVASVSTGKYVVPFFLQDFIAQHSGVRLQVDVTNRSRVLERLRNREVDFALVSLMPHDIPVKHIELVENRLYLFSKFGSEFMPPEGIVLSPSSLSDIPLIVREAGSGTRTKMEQYLREHNVQFAAQLELSSNEAVKQAVIAGLGCSVMPLIGMRGSLRENLVKVLPVKGLPVTSTWMLIWNEDRRHSPVAARYLEFLQTNKSSIISRHFDWYQAYAKALEPHPSTEIEELS